MRRSTKVTLAAALPAAFVLLVFWASGRTPEGAVVLPGGGELPAPPSTITVATWNIHFGCGPRLADGCDASADEIRGYLDGIAAAVKSWGVDILALQEVDRAAFRTHGIDELEVLRRATGLRHAAWTTTWDARWVPYPIARPSRQVGRVLSGQAVLSRYPLYGAVRHALPQPRGNSFLYNLFYLHRAVLEVEAEVAPGRRLRFLNAHLEAFDPDNRTRHAKLVAELVDASEQPTILLGDMNSVPANARVRSGFPDEPEADMTDDSYAILSGTRLEDSVPPELYARDESPWLTFPAAAPNRRLDYIFTSPRLRVESVRTGDAQVSDHRPVIATLRLEP